MHVHVGVKDFTPNEIHNVLLRYSKHEDFIDRLVHCSRRKNNNYYCKTLRSNLQEHMERKEIYECKIQNLNKSIKTCICRAWHGKMCPVCETNRNLVLDLKSQLSHLENMIAMNFSNMAELYGIPPERYYKINIYSFDTLGMLEFRHHNGATDPQTVSNWIRFVINFTEQSKALTPEHKIINQKYAMVCDALNKSKNGLTTKQIAKLGGWKETGVKQVMKRIRNASGKIIEKNGNKWTLQSRPRKIQDYGPLMGLPKNIRQFYKTSNKFAIWT